MTFSAKPLERLNGGEYEADLGQGVCKKRIALPGQGKSGATRSLVAKQHKAAIFFLAGREKSDPGTDFSAKEEEAAKLAGKVLQAATVAKLEIMTTDGVLTEICHEQKNKC